jgi:hypothetical protein
MWTREYLKLMYEIDQSYRALYVTFVDAGDEDARNRLAPIVAAADAEHRARLDEWLAGREWPRLSTHGPDTCEHAWMIALHSDRDVPFQKRVCEAMEQLLAEGDVDAVHYAALYERVMLNEGRPQRYGMLVYKEGGREVPYPIDSPEAVLARRAALRLGDTRFRR